MTLKLSLEDDKLVLRNFEGKVERSIGDFLTAMMYSNGTVDIVRAGARTEVIRAEPDGQIPKNCKCMTMFNFKEKISIINFTKLTSFRLYETSNESYRNRIIADLSYLLGQPFIPEEGQDTILCFFGKISAINAYSGTPEDMLWFSDVLTKALQIAYDKNRIVTYDLPLAFSKNIPKETAENSLQENKKRKSE